jgi:hypothetical protein
MAVFAFTPPEGYRVTSCNENAGYKVGFYDLYKGEQGCDILVYTLSDPAKDVTSQSQVDNYYPQVGYGVITVTFENIATHEVLTFTTTYMVSIWWSL